MKACNKCGEVKSLDQFSINRSCADGHRNACKWCVAEMDRERRRRQKQPDINGLLRRWMRVSSA